MINETKHIVIIQCMTYNQSHYIEDAMKGFIMQQTNFPFVTVVVDDASTDGEQQIIQHFLEKEFDLESSVYDENKDYIRIEANHKKNKKCTFVVVFLKYNHYKLKKQKTPYFKKWFDDAKYVALCEGDDYWTDPLKLQKQVNFLDSHTNYSVCCHRYKIYEQDKNIWSPDYVKDIFKLKPLGFTFTFKDNFQCWITKTMTLMYRRVALPDAIHKRYRYYRDVHMNYHLLQNGLGFCMPDTMAVYRRHQGGVFSPLSNYNKDKINIKIYGELYKHNSHDVDLKENTTKQLDNYLYSNVILPLCDLHIRQFTISDFFLCIYQYWHIKGLRGSLYVVTTSMKSLLLGVIKKIRQTN